MPAVTGILGNTCLAASCPECDAGFAHTRLQQPSLRVAQSPAKYLQTHSIRPLSYGDYTALRLVPYEMTNPASIHSTAGHIVGKGFFAVRSAIAARSAASIELP